MEEATRREQHGFLRSAGTISAAVALSRITGVVREMVMARLFGAGAAYDAFLLGMRIPNLTRNLFAEGALSSAFVPIFTEYLAGRDKRAARELSNVVATALLLVVGALCVAGIVLTPQLVRLMAPGFEQVPGQVRAGGAAYPHHVPVPAAGDAGGAGDGSIERVRPFRRAGAGLRVLQHRLGAGRSWPPASPLAGRSGRD